MAIKGLDKIGFLSVTDSIYEANCLQGGMIVWPCKQIEGAKRAGTEKKIRRKMEGGW